MYECSRYSHVTLLEQSAYFFFSSRRRHTRCYRDWSSDVCSSDLRVLRRRLHVEAQEAVGIGKGTERYANRFEVVRFVVELIDPGRDVHFIDLDLDRKSVV